MLYWNGSSFLSLCVYPSLYQLCAVSVHVNMHVWILIMEAIEASPRGIRDEDIHDAAPMVRALVVERLEQIWSTCSPHVTGGVPRPDPRFVEAGIRVLDRLMKLYRLEAPVPGADQPQGELISKSELVLAQLQELEQRMSDPLG